MLTKKELLAWRRAAEARYEHLGDDLYFDDGPPQFSHQNPSEKDVEGGTYIRAWVWVSEDDLGNYPDWIDFGELEMMDKAELESWPDPE